MRRTLLVAGTAIVAGTALALAVPLSASAHVTIGTNQADPGTYPLVDFKVPTESATATTVKIDITLPTDTPFGEVVYVPVPGWDAELVKEKLDTPIQTDDGSVTEAVTHVIWTAQPGHEITAEQYGVFPVLLGGVPDTGSVTMPVAQTYSDGSVVEWADAPDGDNPAPVLYVNDAPPSGDHHAADPDAQPEAQAAPQDDLVARGLGVAGLVVGAVGIVVAVASRRRSTS